MKKLFNNHYNKFLFITFCLLLSLIMTSKVVSAEYYEFCFVCSDGGGTSYSDWMDERISNKLTIDNRTYMSCDSVTLKLRPVDGFFNNNFESSYYNIQLWREWAPDVSDVNSPISWSTASHWSRPDSITYVYSASDPYSIRRERGYVWNSSWPDNYWFVKYYYSGTSHHFRTKVRYVDSDGITHYFYAVPWSGTGY